VAGAAAVPPRARVCCMSRRRRRAVRGFRVNGDPDRGRAGQRKNLDGRTSRLCPTPRTHAAATPPLVQGGSIVGRVLCAIFGGGITIAIGINHRLHHRRRRASGVLFSESSGVLPPIPFRVSVAVLSAVSASACCHLSPRGVCACVLSVLFHMFFIPPFPSILHSPFPLWVFPSPGFRFFFCFLSFGFLWLFRSSLLSFGFYV
jgi:hypothetical protein